MTDRNFDATALLETYRNAFAPALQAQKAGLKAFERMARLPVRRRRRLPWSGA